MVDVQLADVSLRDGNQSLWGATGLRTEHILHIAPVLNRVGFRWMHLSGPAIAEARQEGPYFSFVPTAPGLYRFALLVGFESKVSMPSVVSVEVGQRPGYAAGPTAAGGA